MGAMWVLVLVGQGGIQVSFFDDEEEMIIILCKFIGWSGFVTAFVQSK